jgi:adenine phosphoribosyltransferase
MDGAIRLVERQQGVVAGLCAIVFEQNPRTDEYRQRYPCISAVVPGSSWQEQANRQTLDSFASYRPEMAFPRRQAT